MSQFKIALRLQYTVEAGHKLMGLNSRSNEIHKTLFCNTKSDYDLACGYIHVHCICYSIAILVFSPRCTNFKACQSYNLQAFSKDYRHGEEFKNFNVQGH